MSFYPSSASLANSILHSGPATQTLCVNAVLFGGWRTEEIAKSVLDTLHGISIKVVCSKKCSEHRIQLFEIIVQKVITLDQNTFKILGFVRILSCMKIFWIACKEMSSFYSQMSVLQCQNLLNARLYKVKLLMCNL